MGKGKGATFERQVSKDISEWWSFGRRDDLVWRTAMSGGRSTVRAKKGKKTAGGAGDLTFTDPSVAPLFDLITFELKRGYPKVSLSDLIDRNDNTRPGEFERWVMQATRSAEQGNTPYWMIIHKRNNRPAMAYMKWTLFSWLKDGGGVGRNTGMSGSVQLARPLIVWRGYVRKDLKAASATRPVNLVAMPFDQFLDLVNPESLGAPPCPKASASRSSKSSPKGR